MKSVSAILLIVFLFVSTLTMRAMADNLEAESVTSPATVASADLAIAPPAPQLPEAGFNPYQHDTGSDLVPIFGIVFVFGMPIAIVWIIVQAVSRKEQMRVELLKDIVASGQPLPDDLTAIFESNAKPRTPSSPIQRGVVSIFAGIGLAILLALVVAPKLAAFGALPAMIGIGILLAHYIETREP